MKKYLRYLTMLAVVSFLALSQLSAQTILCVDRDFGDTSGNFTDTWPMISRALDANGFTYDYHEVLEYEDNGPDANVMGEYDIVIWFTGEAWADHATMGPDDEFNLILYMSIGGGKLFLNGQDYLYDMYPNAGEFNPGEFPYDQLGVVEVVQDVYQIEPGDPNSIGDSAFFVGNPGTLAHDILLKTHDIFTAPTDDGLYGDSIVEHNGESMLSIQYPYISEGTPAIQYETALFRSVFSTIDIAAVYDTIARDQWMGRIVNWLMSGTIGVEELTPSDVELLIMPNPVADFVNIGMMEVMEEVSIYNTQGQLVLFEETNKGSTRMDLSDLTSGMYILKIKTAKGFVTDKIIKQ